MRNVTFQTGGEIVSTRHRRRRRRPPRRRRRGMRRMEVREGPTAAVVRRRTVTVNRGSD